MKDAWHRNQGVVFGVLVVGSLIAGWSILRWQGLGLEQQVKTFDLILKIATTSAIAVGAAWSYNAFLRQRLGVPRLSVTQETKPIRLPDGRHLIKVYVKIENIGQVRVELKLWRLRAEQVLPLTEEIKRTDLPKLAFTDATALWSYFEQGEFSGSDFEMTLEPGEEDNAVGNLVIPEAVEVIQVYSHLHFRADGASGSGNSPGWPCQNIVDLRKRVLEQEIP